MIGGRRIRREMSCSRPPERAQPRIVSCVSGATPHIAVPSTSMTSRTEGAHTSTM